MSTNQQRTTGTVESRTNHSTHTTQQLSQPHDSNQYDTVIIYADGSYKGSKEIAGIGFLLKSKGGTVIEKETEPVTAETSLETEAKAMQNAIKRARSFTPSHMVVHTDCESLVEKVTETQSTKGVYDSIRKLTEDIEFVTIKHIDRSRNETADELAHLALRREEDRLKQCET